MLNSSKLAIATYVEVILGYPSVRHQETPSKSEKKGKESGDQIQDKNLNEKG